MQYISKLTDFRAYEPPYIDTMYFKDGDKTVCIIHADENWNMYGEVLDPFDLPISPIKPIFGQIDQLQCERLIMRNMAPLCRAEELKKKYGFDKVDYAQIMYRTRTICLIDRYWMAWSPYDKVSDYHPLFNEELMKERFKDSIQLDPEEEDMEPFPPRIRGLGGTLFESAGTSKYSGYTFE